ncbi:GPI inositol deacylase, variant 2 [Puccinia graminis f. sp. tritici]|uniref:GPI inositol-deacylase n=1 Tax=Puccinia graminis f. sp. tritici TaxID=56615 RepID=A0A5B0LLC4_PUCGR|nr:GPI inositol deacylase, variant 2 [Puccinia graminis f. sp. tritici]
MLSSLLSTISVISVLISIWSFRSFSDQLHALDLHGFSGPRVSQDGQTSGGARGKSAGSCRMSWMSPSYLPIRPVESRFSSKYSLYLYREHPWDLEQQPSRSPVLFIPGNAGSFRQVRSIAAVTSTTYFNAPQSSYLSRHHPGLDFFTLDFNDDFSAFHGQTLVEQAEFANDAIRSILSIYQESRSIRNTHLPVPSSVLIISHSMGSIVARTMLTMPNYINQTVNTILSLSSPHSIPPITFESGVERVYDQINSLWRQSYSTQPNQGSLEELVLVSIAGGTSDTTVSSDSSSLLSLAPSSTSLTVFTTGIPGVWSPIDHLAILWCNQLAIVLAKTLLEITEPRNQNQVRSVQDRLAILKSHLILGHGVEPFSGDSDSALSKFHLDSLPTNQKAYHLHPPYQSLRLTTADFEPDQPPLVTHIIPLPARPARDSQFTLLSTLVANHNLNVVACKGSFETHLLGSCQSVSARDSQLLPRSQFNPSPVAAPGPDDRADPPQVTTFLQIDHSLLSSSDFLAIQVYTSKSTATGSASDHHSNSDEFLISEFRNLSSSSVVFTSRSFLSFGLFAAATQLLPNQSSLVNEVQLPDMVSSLVAYKLDFTSGSECERGSVFAPLMRQETPLLGESKFHPNLRTAILYTHLSNAYTPTRKMDSEEAQKKAGVRLTFWTDPMVCGGSSDGRTMKIEIKMDLYESVRRVILRYRTAFVSLPAGWLALILAFQLKTLGEGGSFISFGAALSQLVKDELAKILLVIGGAQLIQSFALQMVYSSGGLQTGSSSFALIDPPRLVGDLLLGVSQASFILLDWLLVLVSLGWLVAVYVLLEILLRVSGLLWIKLVGSVDLSPSRSRKHDRPSSPNSLSADRSTLIDYRSLPFLATLAVFTVFYAPYHFAFIVLTILQLITTFQCLLSISQSQSSLFGEKVRNETERKGRYQYNLMILLIMIWLLPISLTTFLVWLRNLQEGWYAPFSDGRNVFNVLGFMGLCYLNRLDLLNHYHPHPYHQSSSSSNSSTSRRRGRIGLFVGFPDDHRQIPSVYRLVRISEWMLKMMGVFCMLYGIRWTYKLFEFFNFGFLFLCSVHLFLLYSGR